MIRQPLAKGRLIRALLLFPAFFLGSLACKASDDRPAPVPIFSRSQLKYGLERTDYYNRWVDRPLFVDPALADPPSMRKEPAPASFSRIRQMAMQYGLHGLGFFPENYGGAADAYRLSIESQVPGFTLLTDFGPSDDLAKKVAFAGMALANPASFRIGGKVVIVSYLADQKPPEFWEDLFRRIREEHGDHFIFLPSLIRFAGESTTQWIPRFDAGTVTPGQVAAIKEGLRKWARATDGLYIESAAALGTKERTFHEAFYRDFLIRTLKEVLAEPEFAGKKYLGLSACVGHENCTRFGYTLSSEGTSTLRRSLEAALAARPDLIVIPEWDEQNENTSLRPTVYNGRTAMRLLRHYTSQEKGELQEPLRGDDAGIPNLVLSYRKMLVLGEKISLELIHVPERGQEKGLTARIELTDEAGRVVHASQPLEIPPGKLWVHTETIPSERFARYHYLLPVVRVTGPSGERIFSEGFQALDLRATWNWDYKWVMQPLRDLLSPTRCDFKIVPPRPPEGPGLLQKLAQFFGGGGKTTGTSVEAPLQVSAQFTADEPLAHVEVLDNDDVIYSHAIAEPQPRETSQTSVFRLDWQSLEWQATKHPLQGSITLKNAQGHWITPEAMKSDGARIVFDGLGSSIWGQRVLLSLPRKQLDAAILAIDLPGVWRGDLPLRQVYDNEIHGLPGPVGFNLVISRFVRQDRIPPLLGTNTVSFTVPVRVDLPGSRLNLQAVAVSGKIYRSRPLLAPTSNPSKRSPLRTRKVTVFSDHAGLPVEGEVNETRVPNIDYQFAPEQNGSILRTAAGRPFWAILGGYSTQATGRGGGESRDGTPFLKPGDYPANLTDSLPADYAHEKIGNHSGDAAVQSAPGWAEVSPGVHALVFNGKSTFLTLPQGVIPRRASYEISMELMPDHVRGKQLLISHRSFYPGSLTVFLDNGTVKARFLAATGVESNLDSGLAIEPGKWTKLNVRYTQKALLFEVDGQAAKPIPLPGPGCYDTVGVVGGYGQEWFAGKLKSLRIRHGDE